ncbi:MAG: hypothetical protein NC200_05485 [Candidatus Gastranaerophilales bacterium]|nr:hypothetical protein [Candidatus Gastranaerophilales bacterium]
MLSSVNNYNNQNFGASYHTYFYSTEGKRLVSEADIKKCLHYMEAHLNGSKRVKTLNQDLITTMKQGQMTRGGLRVGGDRDYAYNPKIRAVFDKAKQKYQDFVTIITGNDVDVVNNKYGKPIGRAKRASIERCGLPYSAEVTEASRKYAQDAPEYAESKAVYRDGRRLAFGICFTPVYGKRSGKLTGFEYHHSGFFYEDLANPKK